MTLKEVLNLTKRELHEMQLAQKNRAVPRNPELTTAAIEAVDTLLAGIEAAETRPGYCIPSDFDMMRPTVGK